MDFKRPLQEEAETSIKHFIEFLFKSDIDRLIMTQSHKAPGMCSFLRNYVKKNCIFKSENWLQPAKAKQYGKKILD